MGNAIKDLLSDQQRSLSHYKDFTCFLACFKFNLTQMYKSGLSISNKNRDDIFGCLQSSSERRQRSGAAGLKKEIISRTGNTSHKPLRWVNGSEMRFPSVLGFTSQPTEILFD